MSKSIDLGAMQKEARDAATVQKSARAQLDAAYTKHDNAAQALERAREKHRLAVEAVEMKKKALVEAARQVANG